VKEDAQDLKCKEKGRNIKWHFVEMSKKSLRQYYSKNNPWQLPMDKKFLKPN
jgi:hypothetical protein